MDEESRAERLRRQAEEKLGSQQGEVERLPKDVQELFHELQVHQIELEMQNEALREAQQRRGEVLRLYTDLYDFAPVGYLDLDREGRIERANLTASAQLKVSRGPLVGRSLYDFIHTDGQDALFKQLRRVLRSRKRQSCEVRTHDGTYLLLESVFFPGDVKALCRTSLTDITARKQAERQLARALGDVEDIVNTVHDALRVLDEELKVVTANPAFYRAFVQKNGEVIGCSFFELAGGLWDVPQLGDRLQQVIPRNLSIDGYEVEGEVNGRRTIMLVSARRMQCGHQEPERILVTVYDVTEARLAERNLKEAHDHLEERVRERTAELAERNHELEAAQDQLHRLSGELLTAQEQERKRVSHELHDSIGQSLAALKFAAQQAFAKLPEDSAPQVQESISALVRIVQDTLDELRRIEKDLWPPTLEILGLIQTIQSFCRDTREIYGVKLEDRLEVDEGKVPEILKIVVFRIVQEAVQNAVKHSGSERIFIDLQNRNAQLELVIRDRGKGFDVGEASAGPGDGIGLQSMRERAELSGGMLSIESAPGKGTVVRATWPI
jgi:PAS domain S-box-containing protein